MPSGLSEHKFFHYELVRKIGSGPIGSVYQAVHPTLSKVRAVKIIAPQLSKNTTFAKSIQQSGGEAARLIHPNITRLYNFGFHEPSHRFVFVSDLVDGSSLAGQLTRTKTFLPLNQVLHITISAAKALGYAHSLNPPVLHSDLKPSNILLANDGSVKLSDFGMDCTDKISNTLTGSGVSRRLFRYASPEQLDKNAEVGIQSDIYSLGVILYEMITHKVPLQTSFKNPAAFNPGIVPALSAVCMNCLEADLTKRYKNCAALLKDLETIYKASEIKHLQEETIQKAQKLIAERHFRKAAQLLDDLLKQDPGCSEAIKLKKRCMEHFSAVAEVKTALSSATELLKKKKYSAALAEIKPVLHSFPEHTGIINFIQKVEEAEKKEARIKDYLQKGTTFYYDGEYAQAISQWESALQLDPDNQKAKKNIQAVREKLNRIQDKVVKLYSEARAAMEKKDYISAIRIYEEVLELNPLDPRANEQIGKATTALETQKKVSELLAFSEEAMKKKEFDKSLSLAEKILEIDPGNVAAQNLSSKARSALERIQQIKPLLMQAGKRFKEGKIPECEKILRQVLERDSDNPEARRLLENVEKKRLIQARVKKLYSKANSLIKEGRLQDALRFLEKSRAEYPDNPELAKLSDHVSRKIASFSRVDEMYNEAHELFRDGKHIDSLRIVEKILRIAPDHINANQLHSHLLRATESRQQTAAIITTTKRYLKQGKATEALEEIQKANQYFPEVRALKKKIVLFLENKDEIQELYKTAAGFADKGKFRKATKIWLKILELAPVGDIFLENVHNTQLALKEHAQRCARKGNFKTALQIYENLLEFEPGDAESALARKKLAAYMQRISAGKNNYFSGLVIILILLNVLVAGLIIMKHLDKKKKNQDELIRQAEIMLNDDQFDNCLENIRQVLDENKNHVAANDVKRRSTEKMLRQARLFFQSGNPKEGNKLLDTLLKYFPKNEKALKLRKKY